MAIWSSRRNPLNFWRDCVSGIFDLDWSTSVQPRPDLAADGSLFATRYRRPDIVSLHADPRPSPARTTGCVQETGKRVPGSFFLQASVSVRIRAWWLTLPDCRKRLKLPVERSIGVTVAARPLRALDSGVDGS